MSEPDVVPDLNRLILIHDGSPHFIEDHVVRAFLVRARDEILALRDNDAKVRKAVRETCAGLFRESSVFAVDQVRAEALEEAARACESQYRGVCSDRDYAEEIEAMAIECADAIRALKDKRDE
jgi:phage shock protein A